MTTVARRVCAKCGVDVDPLGCERCPKCGHDTYKPIYEQLKHPRARWIHPKDLGPIAAVVIGLAAVVFLTWIVFG